MEGKIELDSSKKLQKNIAKEQRKAELRRKILEVDARRNHLSEVEAGRAAYIPEEDWYKALPQVANVVQEVSVLSSTLPAEPDPPQPQKIRRIRKKCRQFNFDSRGKFKTTTKYSCAREKNGKFKRANSALERP